VQIGAENRKKAIAAGALFLVAIAMFFRMFVGGSSESSSGTPSSNPANAGPTQAKRKQTARKNAKATPEKSGPLTPSLDPRLHLDLLAAAENTEYTGKGRNLFDMNAAPEIPAPIASGKIDKPADVAIGPQPLPPPPPPPPINLKFYGFTSSGGVKKVFLMQNDDVFVATEGDIVQRRYKIVKINNTNVEVLDVLSNNKQSIPLTAG